MHKHAERRLPAAWAALILPFGVIFCVACFMVLCMLSPGDPVRIFGRLGMRDERAVFIFIYGIGAVGGAGCLYLLLRKGRMTLRDVGLRGRLSVRNVLYAAGGVAVAWLLYPCVEALFSAMGVRMYWNSSAITPVSSTTGIDAVMVAVAALVMAPIAEEVTFRGYLMTMMMQRHSTPVAVVASLVASSLLHVPFFGPGFALYMIPWSAICCYLFLEFDSLYPCIVFHAANNFLGYIAMPMLLVSLR